MAVTRANTVRKVEHENTECMSTVASQIPEALVLVANIRRGRPKQSKQEQVSAAERDALTRGYQQIIEQIAQDASEGSGGRRRQFVCTVSGCGKVFYQRAHLNIHIRSHTGYKPYACRYPGCGKTFPQLGNMKTHERTHTGDRPFVCHIPDCRKAFSQRGNLTTHLKKVHNIATRRSRGEPTFQPT
ncbi:DNA-binding transcription factor [Coemansia guatemalensis]|uniref:DNA-binding transcription factor n=1 Tax=Coemansia guatemalensis TaxID=2761395 RepID=A0A9W8HUL5_9FUNG|nr:DNA-binding transcription factor [Coemansia guatemalensis]